MTSKNGLDALLTPESSALILIDHQPFQFANLHSHEPTMVVNNVIGLAKTARAFGVPTILANLCNLPVDADISRVQVGYTGGSPLPTELAARFGLPWKFIDRPTGL